MRLTAAPDCNIHKGNFTQTSGAGSVKRVLGFGQNESVPSSGFNWSRSTGNESRGGPSPTRLERRPDRSRVVERSDEHVGDIGPAIR